MVDCETGSVPVGISALAVFTIPSAGSNFDNEKPTEDESPASGANHTTRLPNDRYRNPEGRNGDGIKPMQRYCIRKRVAGRLLVLALVGFLFLAGTSLARARQTEAGGSYTFSWPNYTLYVSGGNVSIYTEGTMFPVRWVVGEVTSSGIKMMQLSNITVTSVDNTMQNSVIVQGGNPAVHVAQVYSFERVNSFQWYGIDASMAVQNLREVNASFIIGFMVTTPFENNVQVNGFAPAATNFTGSHGNTYSIPRQDWQVQSPLVEVNWINEASLFNGGVITTNYRSDMILLPFGPVTLLSNETLTLDPMFCDGGGGGGGGGGGSGGSPPSGISLNMAVKGYGTSLPGWLHTFSGDLPVWFNGTVSSLGSGGDTLSITGHTDDFGSSSSATLYSHSISSNSYSFEWTSRPGVYTKFTAEVSNSYGSTSTSISQNIGIYTFFSDNSNNQANNFAKIEASNGTVLGYISQSMYGLNGYFPATSYKLPLASSFDPGKYYSNYGVNTAELNLTLERTNVTTVTNSYIDQSLDGGGIESNSGLSNAATQALVNFIVLVLTADAETAGFGIALAAITDIMALQSSSYYNNLGNGGTIFDVNHSAGGHAEDNYTCDRFGEYCFPTYYIVTSPNGSYTYVFNVTDSLTFKQPVDQYANEYNSTNAVIDEFMFSIFMSVTSSTNNTVLDSSFASVPVYTAQWDGPSSP